MLNSNGFLPRQYLQLLVLLLSAGIAMSGSVVKTLPGYSGDLPFTLETGYIGVGNTEDVQLFYYFVESQRSPAQDPVVLWLTGGPGCSTLLAFFYESAFLLTG
nr:serine carboxypeptidase-like 13 [Quercus suber]